MFQEWIDINYQAFGKQKVQSLMPDRASDVPRWRWDISKVNLPYYRALVYLFSFRQMHFHFWRYSFAQSVQGYDDMAKIDRACTGHLNAIGDRAWQRYCSGTDWNPPTSPVYIESTLTMMRLYNVLTSEYTIFCYSALTHPFERCALCFSSAFAKNPSFWIK